MTHVADKTNIANNAIVTGLLEKEFEFRHESFGERFYKSRIRVKRTSGIEDFVPILVSSKLMNGLNIKSGEPIMVQGQFRSYRKVGDDGKRHLEFFLFVIAINKHHVDKFEKYDNNIIYLYGKISNPIHFKVSRSGRAISEFMVLVPRKHKGSDFIPCIGWESMSDYFQELKVGDYVEISARIQSRKYFKRIQNSADGEYKDTYEISIFNIKKVE